MHFSALCDIQEHMSRKPLGLRFIVTATLLGNTLAWYDVATFGFLAPILTRLFFPVTDVWTFPLLAMMAVAFGSILRPAGGIFFGYIGDRYGRRVALLTTVFAVSLPTLILGLLPTYSAIGISATILFVVMRLLQGLSAGGEFPAAITFLVESSSRKNRGFIGSFAYFGVALGICLGGLDFFFLHTHFTEETFAVWGWRSMYILGSLLGWVAFWLRFKLRETPIYQEILEAHDIVQHPIKMLFQKHKKAMAKLIGIETLETLGFNLTITFLVIYVTEVLKLSIQEAIHLNLIFLTVLVVSIPLAGLLSSRIGPKKLAVRAAWSYFLLSIPLFWLMEFDTLRFLCPMGLAILVALYMAPMPALYCELFPTKVRNSGIGVAFNLAVGLIGGFAPLLALVAISYTGLKMAPGIILMIGSLISLATLHSIKHESLSNA